MTAYYLAGLFGRQKELAGYAAEIRSWGHTVTSRWLDETPVDMPDPYAAARAVVDRDFEDVRACDTTLLFTQPRGEPQVGGGRFVEFGYAWAIGRTLAVVGPVENVFVGHPDIRRYADWEDFRNSVAP